MLLRNEPNTTSPSRGRVVQDVIHVKPVRVPPHQVIQFLLEQYILHVDIGVDQTELGFILGIFEDSPNDLKHWSYSRATRDHAKLSGETRGIYELALGTFDADLVADFKEANVLGDVPGLVRLTLMMINGENP